MFVNTIIVTANVFLAANLKTRLVAYSTCGNSEASKSEPEIMDQPRNIDMERKSVKYMFTWYIQDIELIRKVGKGYRNKVFLGRYNNLNVAVQLSTKDVDLVYMCIRDINETDFITNRLLRACKAMPSRKLFREIIMYEQLPQASLVRMLGFCIGSEKIESEYLEDHGIVAVFE